MKKYSAPLLPAVLCLLGGCTSTGNKTTDISAIYIVTTLLSILLLTSYFLLIRKKEKWLVLLFVSTVIINIGYLWLSKATTLDSALMANRVAYLGSVFLPPTMLMTIIKVSRLQYKKRLPPFLVVVSLFVFVIAASPGYSDIYYKEVSLRTVNGVTILEKVYGSWHFLYLVFLLVYFAAMVAAITHATVKKKVPSNIQAVFLAGAVLANICVWFIEQFVRIDFEVLSISYIISELFLLGLYLLMQEGEKLFLEQSAIEIESAQIPKELIEQQKRFAQGLKALTPTEKSIYELYVAGKGTKEVLEALNIKENTLKFHNKNLYSKLGVSSRKQLLEIAKWL